MYCPNCGKEIAENALFCGECGTKIKEAPDVEPTDAPISTVESVKKADVKLETDLTGSGNQEASGRNDTVCPFCKEAGCTPMQKSTTEVNSKNYKWGSGCCGMFLLGPFGLLCGLCGTGSKVKTENELWWACMKCGKQHISLDDALKKWEIMVEGLMALGVATGVEAIIGKIILECLFGEGFIASVIVFVLLIGVIFTTIYASVTEAKKVIDKELGEPIDKYLTKEQKDNENTNQLIATGIAIAIGLLGIPILNMVLG